MSIFTEEVLLERIKKMDLATAKAALEKIVRIKIMAELTRGKIGRVIMRLDVEDKKTTTVQLNKERTISTKALEDLSKSVMADYVEEIIMAALDPRGPFQSREIMVLAAQIKGGNAPFITGKGIPQAMKNQAGYILSMAGFERRSHYDRERKMPVKAWQPKHGYTHMTIEQRVSEVRATINYHLGQEHTPKPKLNLLGSFL